MDTLASHRSVVEMELLVDGKTKEDYCARLVIARSGTGSANRLAIGCQMLPPRRCVAGNRRDSFTLTPGCLGHSARSSGRLYAPV